MLAGRAQVLEGCDSTPEKSEGQVGTSGSFHIIFHPQLRGKMKTKKKSEGIEGNPTPAAFFLLQQGH